ncbi:MAG: hypothetical protein CMJ89_07265 [Planctomycetes bacterium]|nr:hypothetical protein [Planctomycetota bacterium]
MVQSRPPFLRCTIGAITVFGLAGLTLGAADAARLAAFHGWEHLGLDWLQLELWSRQRPLFQAGILAALSFALMLFVETRPPGGGLSGFLRKLNTLLGFPPVAVLALAAFFVLPNALAGLQRPDAPANAPNVLFVLVDTWRADHAGFLGYERDVSPNLDRLVEEGVVFERAISSSGWTQPAVASLFTGLIPSRHGAVSQPLAHTPVRGALLQPFVTTFVEIFRASGWNTAMWSNNPNITPARGFDQGASYFRDYYSQRARTQDDDVGRAERMLPDVEAWLAEENTGERPFCAYVHIMDPHYPYVAPAPFKGTFDRSGLDFQLLGPVCREIMTGKRRREDITPTMRRRIVDIYDEELLYVDSYLGEFLQRIFTEHPNTVVVLSGDHGEEFLEHGNYGHGHAIWNELTHVPLVLWAPDLEPQRIPHQMRLMDVFPTLLELAGIGDRTPPHIQGKTLAPFFEGTENTDRLAPVETGGDQKPAWQWRAVSDGRFKYLRRERNLPVKKAVPPLSPGEDPEDFPIEYLFDLKNDPFEQENLFELDPVRAADLFAQMRKFDWYVPPSELLKAAAHSADLSAEDANRLDALGYGGDDDGHGHP